MIDILYFAWVRERVGAAEERVASSAPTVGALVDELRARGEGHARAFADTRALCVAVDQEMADFATPIAGAREIAFFPPMTGG